MANFPFLRTAEDLVVVAGSAVATWQSTKSVSDVVAAVSAAPVVRSGLALALSKGQSSGLVETVSLLRRAVTLLTDVPPQVVTEPEIVAPDPAQGGYAGKHATEDAAAAAVPAAQ